MKKAIVVFTCLCLLLCMSGCKSRTEDSYDSVGETLSIETLLLENLPEIIDVMPEFMQYSETPVYLSETCRVILAVAGDLNSDGNDDLAIVTELMEEDEDNFGYAEGEFGFGSRHIYVLLGTTGGSYEIANKSQSLILKHWMGGTFGDPLESVTIENGTLHIKHYGGSSSRWGYVMDFSYSGGQLILTDMTAISHSTLTANGEETLCDFVNHTVKRYTWGYSEDQPLLLFSGQLPDKIHLFDNITFDEIVSYSDIPFLPYLDHYRFDRFDKPIDLKISASQALDMIMAEHYPDFEKVYIPWTRENQDNYSRLLFYEFPGYYYQGGQGTLKHFQLDVHEEEGQVSGATHTVIFAPYEGYEMEFYDIKDQ